MRYFYLFVVTFCILVTGAASAQQWEDQRLFKAPQSTHVLRVLSSTDISFFAPVIEQFLQKETNVSVEYLVMGTADLDTIFRQSPSSFDVVISSAMDLQLKLVNDGYALKITGVQHPEWAQWRQSLFAFTAEPAAIVINRVAFEGWRKPQTRQDLILALRARPDFFRGKIGTYDVRASGLGYLFATQDARVSETYWRLMEVMGGLDTQLYCCSGDMLDDLADGTLAIAYNVLGSYARARTDVLDKVQIILPSDFPTTMMRTAFVPKETQQRQAAISFLKHLVSRKKTENDHEAFHTPALAAGPNDAGQSMITLEPALLTYLDALKRQKFIRAWEDAIIQ
jgi:iron(III) transport system substrate-binding protein